MTEQTCEVLLLFPAMFAYQNWRKRRSGAGHCTVGMGMNNPHSFQTVAFESFNQTGSIFHHPWSSLELLSDSASPIWVLIVQLTVPHTLLVPTHALIVSTSCAPSFQICYLCGETTHRSTECPKQNQVEIYQLPADIKIKVCV